MAGRRNKRRIVSTSSRVPVPEALVTAIQDGLADCSELHVKRKVGRRWKMVGDPVIVVTPEDCEAAEVEWVEAENTPEAYAAACYDRARDEAIGEGSDHYLFLGWHQVDERSGEEVFRLTLRVETDEDGEAMAAVMGEGDGDASATVEILTNSVQRFVHLLERSHRCQVTAGEKQFEQLAMMREAMALHYEERAAIEESKAEMNTSIAEVNERTVRAEAVGQSIQSILATFGPMIQERMRQQAKPEEPKKAESDTEPPSGEKSPPKLCSDAGVLDRCLSRLTEKQLHDFRVKFSDEQWSCWEKARSATEASAFDGAVVDLLRKFGALERDEASAAIMSWIDAIPPEPRTLLIPVALGLGNRIAWPLAAEAAE